MKRIVIFAAVAFVLLVSSVRGAWAFGVKDVLAMHQDGIADSLIIEKIHHSGATFHLGSKDLVALHRAGVSDEVVGAMLRSEDRHDWGYGYAPYPYYYGPYDPYWGWPYYSPFVVGFDFRYGPSFRHGYGYRPFYGGRFGGGFGRGFRR